MSEVKWSDNQKSIIEARNSNILVSAAAGSGKTAVLVERIIRLVTDRENPTGLDELIVMTFTRAAAEEIKLRVGKALSSMLKKEPDNEYLKIQKNILPRARIGTIDGICQELIRQNYQLLSIDPGFRVLDEGEKKLLFADIMAELMEKHFSEGEESFYDIYNSVQRKAADSRFSELVLKIFANIDSEPWTMKALKALTNEADKEINGDFENTEWFAAFLKMINDALLRHDNRIKEAEELINCGIGPDKYISDVEEVIEKGERLIQLTNPDGDLSGRYKEISDYFEDFQLKTLSRAKKDQYDPEVFDFVKDAINGYKKYLKDLRNEIFMLDDTQMKKVLCETARISEMLCKLAGEFSKRYEEEKTERNAVDFSDMEHMALKLLYKDADNSDDTDKANKADNTDNTDNEDNAEIKGETIETQLNKSEFTDLADEMAKSVKEVMIDEYQDSNYMQEALIKALSAERFGRPDVFMVGDVKQSIYSFRKAKPELFMEKYDTFKKAEDSTEAIKDRKIVLNENYRSVPEILDFVNNVFYAFMRKEIGGIDYDKDAALYHGMHEDVSDEKNVEFLLVDTEENNSGYTDEELEYRLIARKIKEQRKYFNYRDMAILVRKGKKKAELLTDILSENGIPAYYDASTGYFDATEVKVMLSFLSIIDNPYQDIPLAAVMLSPCGGFSNEEIALIAADGKEKISAMGQAKYSFPLNSFGKNYLFSYLKVSDTEKSKAFIKKINDYRELADVYTVPQLLHRIYMDTGYYSYVSALPEGKVRRKNLDMLLYRAENYANLSYSGLSGFNRYIESLKQYDTDYGEALSVSGNDDIVRICTIHGSKGLQYPLVFIAKCGSDFTRTPDNSDVITDSKYGIGMTYTDKNEGITYPSIKRYFISQKKKIEEYGEELRILYVAMTRAEKKLIMTGTLSKAAEKKEKAEGIQRAAGEALDYDAITGTKTYAEILLKSGALEGKYVNFCLLSPEDIVNDVMTDDEQNREKLDDFLNANPQEKDESEFAKLLKNGVDFKYKLDIETGLRPKVSVSELKKEEMNRQFRENLLKSMEEEEKSEENIGYLKQGSAKFGTKDSAKGGSGKKNNKFNNDKSGIGNNKNIAPKRDSRNLEEILLAGDAFHKACEICDLSENALEDLLTNPKYSQKYKDILDKEKFEAFLHSKLCRRMKEALEKGHLRREQRFMAGFPACELNPDVESGALQILQGIIDAYIEEDDGSITIIDYKTDKAEDKNELVEKYRIQLDLYAEAIARITGKSVKQKIIYSTFLGEEIDI